MAVCMSVVDIYGHILIQHQASISLLKILLHVIAFVQKNLQTALPLGYLRMERLRRNLLCS